MRLSGKLCARGLATGAALTIAKQTIGFSRSMVFTCIYGPDVMKTPCLMLSRPDLDRQKRSE